MKKPVYLYGLNKVTDKFVSELSPAELGVYCFEMYNKFTNVVDAGKMTEEDFERELEHFYTKHVQCLSPGDFIKFILSKGEVTEKSLLREIAKRDLRIFELRMTILEFSIETRARYERLLGLILLKDCDPEEADKKLLAIREETRENLKPFFEGLEDLRNEYQQYKSHEMWSKEGGLPAYTEPNSILDPRTVKMYAPTTYKESDTVAEVLQ